jgi:hypothetical protein
VNLFQRLIRMWWTLWAAASGIEVSRIEPLPQPLVAPWAPAATLIAEAAERGAQDAHSLMLNQWTFGGPEDEESELFDPDYVRELRRRSEIATASLRAIQRLADDRVAAARRKRDEADELMGVARTGMSQLAARESRDEEPAPIPDERGDEVDPGPDPEPDPAAPAEGPRAVPWVDSVPLRLIWRLVILAGLIAAELPVQFYVFDYFLGTDPATAGLARWLALTTAAIIVFGPFVAATLLRARQAAGSDRRMGYVIIVMVAAWLAAVGVLGFIRGRVLQADSGRSAQLHVTPATIILMFIALLLIVGAMAFMLGLARRHPLQEAYLHQRVRRDRFDMVMRTMATRVYPGYEDPENGEPLPAEAQQRAVQQTYAAAENAYFAALSRTVGDPVFTEAVQHRRGLRVPA